MFSTPDEVENAFYEALEQGDIERLMEAWADDEDVICVHPGGSRLIGVHAVRAAWSEILADSAVPMRVLRRHIVQGLMDAVHTVVEQITLDTHEGPRTVSFYATNVYHKGPSGWRMVLHHASQAPDDATDTYGLDAPDILH